MDHPTADGPPDLPVEAEPAPGRGIVQASWAGTAVFTVSAVLAAIWPDRFRIAAAAIALVLFAAGCVVFLWAYAIAVGRSRHDAIGIGGLYFLADSAPKDVQRTLMLSFAVEIVVSLATAGVRPFTSLAFGTLVPVFGLGLAGLWGARYGHFPPRRPEVAEEPE
jgi:hypothetical protein